MVFLYLAWTSGFSLHGQGFLLKLLLRPGPGEAHRLGVLSFWVGPNRHRLLGAVPVLAVLVVWLPVYLGLGEGGGEHLLAGGHVAVVPEESGIVWPGGGVA